MVETKLPPINKPKITKVSQSIKDILAPAFDVLMMDPANEQEYIADVQKILTSIVAGAYYRFDAKDLWDLFEMDCVFIGTRMSWRTQMPKNIVTLKRVVEANEDNPIIDVFIHDDDEGFKFDVRVIKPIKNQGQNKWY
nr:MAG TPA: hypothetical protein [Caudoviricetes sp.]